METSLMLTEELKQLKSTWEQLIKESPQLRIRDAAQKLGVSELSLLMTDIGNGVTRLEGNWQELFKELPKLGKVMALTRSDACVLEHKGNFQKIEINGEFPNGIGTVIGPIEQRVFFSAWRYGLVVEKETPRGPSRSFQFFDKQGDAILKVFTQNDTDMEAFYQIKSFYEAAYQDPNVALESFETPEYETNIDIKAFASDWANMKDTHEFFGMIRKYKLHRQEALRLIGKEYAYQIAIDNLEKVLNHASETQLPIMIFAGNRGNIQIHQGKVKVIRMMGDWLNVLDPRFNMHLDLAQIKHAWVVKKPTEDGIVTSIELFDHNAQLAAQFFGLRKPGLRENQDWAALVNSFESIV